MWNHDSEQEVACDLGDRTQGLPLEVFTESMVSFPPLPNETGFMVKFSSYIGLGKFYYGANVPE